MDKTIKDFLEDILNDNPLKTLAKSLADIWELQDKLKELEREIIKGNVASVELEVNITARKVKEGDKDYD